MGQERGSTSSGIGFGGGLFCVFLVLKLCGVIAWSWWWVTAPLWVPVVVVVAILAVWCVWRWRHNLRG